MATPAIRRKRPHLLEPRWSHESAALRLSAAERPEEVLPILLEEVIHLGFTSAAALELDFDTGQIKPAVSLNFTQQALKPFNTSLWASENPVVSSLVTLKPALIPEGRIHSGSCYVVPMIYRN